MTEAIVRVENLKTHFTTVNGTVRAVDGVSFTVHRGEILAIVGESGSGKTVAVRNLLGLNDSGNAAVEGSISYLKADSAGESLTRNLMGLNHDQWRDIRGREIGMIFQEPMSSFDPLTRLGKQAVEAYRAHFEGTDSQVRDRIITLLRKVRIPDAEKRFDQYPHEMSGGMLQRFMIAMVLSCRPALLIADEPTTALDVTIQAQILKLIREIQRDLGTSIIFISHDLGVVSQIADRVIVMYGGKIVERADVHTLFSNPLHPYTKGLLESRVKPRYKGHSLPSIGGTVPRPTDSLRGCRFAPRCEFAMEKCRTAIPDLTSRDMKQEVSCWLYEEAR